MSPNGRVQVVVRTRRIPVGTTLVTTPVYTTSGILVGSTTNRVVIYDTGLDEVHRRAIREGHLLSCRLGLELEVVDVSKSGLLRRLISLVRRGANRQLDFLVAPQGRGR